MIAALVITSLAAGHGIAAGYLLRQLKKKPRPKLRHWQTASVVFPAGVMVYLLWLAKQEIEK